MNASGIPARNPGLPLVSARGLVRHFRAGGVAGPAASSGHARVVRAVDGVDLELAAGETVALVGESGSGKSTLGRLLLMLQRPDAGEVLFEGRALGLLGAGALRRARRSMQMIFQDPYGSLNPRLTIGQTLTEPLGLHGLHRGRHQERVGELLERVGLPSDARRRYPHEFSGGQRQRVAIARALAVEPRFVVCDEAVSALDVSIQAQVLNLLLDLQDQLGLAYLFIAHDLAVVRHVADRVAVMYLGKIVEEGPSAELFATPRHPYTQALLAAIPVARVGQRIRAVPLAGDPPSPLAVPRGCRFHPRCVHAQALCAEVEPSLVGASGHAVACHLWRELPTPTIQPNVAAPSATNAKSAMRIEQLARAFAPRAPLMCPASGPAAGPEIRSDPV